MSAYRVPLHQRRNASRAVWASKGICWTNQHFRESGQAALTIKDLPPAAPSYSKNHPRQFPQRRRGMTQDKQRQSGEGHLLPPDKLHNIGCKWKPRNCTNLEQLNRTLNTG